MITMCSGGWHPSVRHAPRVLRDDGVRDNILSHACCDACAAAMHRDLDQHEGTSEHERYLASPLDPRD